MKMLKIIAPLFFLGLSVLHAEEPSKEHLAAAKKLTEAMKLNENYYKNFYKTFASQMGPRISGKEEALKKAFAKVFDWEKIGEDVIETYAKHYTQKECEELTAFFASKTGQKFSQSNSDVMIDLMKMDYKLMSQNQAEIMMALRGPKPEAKSWVGKEMPAVDVNWLKGQVDLKGKPRLIEFWATWCPPCLKSIPHLNELYGKYKDKDFVIVGVTNEPAETINKFLKKTPINYSVGLDPSSKLSRVLGHKGIPHAYLVDKNGKIVWHGHPATLTGEIIEKVL